MKRRRYLSLCLTLLLVALLLVPAVHWRLIGWVKGEAFYQGRPTSWWSREAESLQLLIASTDEDWLFNGWMRPSSTVDEVLGTLKIVTITRAVNDFALLQSDPDALPVLIELLRDPSPQVRHVAAQALSLLREEAAPARVALEIACHDENFTVRPWARQALRCIELPAKPK